MAWVMIICTSSLQIDKSSVVFSSGNRDIGTLLSTIPDVERTSEFVGTTFTEKPSIQEVINRLFDKGYSSPPRVTSLSDKRTLWTFVSDPPKV